jgi:phosphate starvation-inducible protein PhoH
LLKDRKTTLKLVTGGFGTGKTMMMVAAALDAVEKGEFDKIIWVRNNI